MPVKGGGVDQRPEEEGASESARRKGKGLERREKVEARGGKTGRGRRGRARGRAEGRERETMERGECGRSSVGEMKERLSGQCVPRI